MQPFHNKQDAGVQSDPGQKRWFGRVLRFGLVGGVNTVVDLLLLNKFWTFGYRQRTTWREVMRFIVTTLCGIGWSSIILWLTSNALHPLLINTTVWANASKVVAISGTAVISYLGMSLWVFVNKTRTEHIQISSSLLAYSEISDEQRELPKIQRLSAFSGHQQSDVIVYGHEAVQVDTCRVQLQGDWCASPAPSSWKSYGSQARCDSARLS